MNQCKMNIKGIVYFLNNMRNRLFSIQMNRRVSCPCKRKNKIILSHFLNNFIITFIMTEYSPIQLN